LTAVRVIKTNHFDRWFRQLKDIRAAARIQVRLDRLAAGNPGDVRPVGGGVSELRIDHGPGYRVYYQQKADVLIVLLLGGDKSSQAKDIKRARELAEEWDDSDQDGVH
jgi:putative addiction module killer protein